MSFKRHTEHWDRLTIFQRLNLILENRDLFISFCLVTPGEIKKAKNVPMREWEYILSREAQPVFATINLRQTLDTQACREQLKTALEAVFL